ncbi:MAG TPA: 16S rRNA (guanine(966)-N(2))-methyltransferase RsmD, partial [Beijerinckiaceae bacterium]|nr:16S rRNA (guanine(966)-N(2))-methyltransferase RsmD [Beijerinckiaceae bacterium]
DRLREALFNILAHAYDNAVEGARVIDLFAGTGALGLEALSRGARFALFVDDGAEARSLIRRNVEALAVGGITKIFRRDATKLGDTPGERYTLAFLDPPYGRNLITATLVALRDGAWLAENALAIVEETADADITLPEGYRLIERRAYGDTQVVFLRVAA